MIAYKLSLVVVLAFLGVANAQVIAGGSCPKNITVKADFSVEDYLGVWYEYSVYPIWFERNGKCITAEYTLQCDGNVGVYNKLFNKKTQKIEEIEGYAEVVENAKLNVVFPNSQTPYNATSNYWVLDTDYKSYSVVYSCQTSSKVLHWTFVWILTRQRHPCENTIQKAEHVLSNAGLSLADLVMTDQSGCHI